jgi:polysaccharide chain length determinant protein (PEP-CTERM system associated)
MKADEQTFLEFLKILRKRVRPAAIAAFAVLLAMTCFVFLMPAVYESRATMLIEQLDLPAELAGGPGTRDYVEQRLQRTRQLVLTDENISNLIKRYGLYVSEGEVPDETQIATFVKNVFITPQVTGVIDPRTMRSAELTYAFDVGFWDSDPKVSTDVANELASLFVASSVTRALEDAQRSIEFARSESERLAEELRLREGKLASFREKSPGGLPEDRVRNQDRAMSLERELATVDADLRAARARRDLLDAQLRDTARDAPSVDSSGQVVLGSADRLAVAKQELVAALARYSEDHPDVRRLRREIATLTTESAGTMQSPPTNPAYLQLESQVNSAAIEIRELSTHRGSISGQLYSLQGAVTLSPRLEEQYQELVRDYEVIKTQYEQMRAQQASAEMRSKAAGSTANETYVLINPARIPDQPVEPDRVALMFLAIVLSISAGIGTAFFLNAADTTVRGSSDVVALAGAQPFAHIPTMQNNTEVRRKRLVDFALAGGITLLAIVVFVIVN